MSKIVGVTVGTALSPDKIKEKINPVLSVNGVKPDEMGNVDNTFTFEDLTEEQKATLQGEDGGYYKPLLFNDGTLMFTPSKNDMLPLGSVGNIKGPKGDKGDSGYTPQKGIDYFDGADGYTPKKNIDYFDGKDGADGYTPQKNIDYFDGKDGADGKDGGYYIPSLTGGELIFTPTVDGMKPVGSVGNIKGADGAKGADGKSAYAYAQDGGYEGTEEEFAKKLASGEGDNYVTAYGAKGDGITDDTQAFVNALAENRVVHVPGGTYKLTSGIVIGENCELELAQDAVLNFTQTSGNCITLNVSSSLKGNHATINVPYAFNGNVVYADTTTTASESTSPPFTKWSPQWKTGRYITDLNICKSDSRGFHYSVDGDCYGTAIYISADGNATLTYMWGVHYSNLRIAGGFKYGIRAVNFNQGWNHEMRVDAFIDACEIGVSLENCNNAYISAVVQPRRAYSMAEVYSPYAKHGIELINSRNTDLSGSRVWDWNETNSLWTHKGEYQHIAMKGNCSGTILNDYLYYETSYDIRDLIYTDTASNLEKINILQEPFTRWFKPKDGEPYFSDGFTEKKIALTDDIDRFFETDTIPLFTDVLATAIDTDGTIFKGIGYTKSGYIATSGAFTDNAKYTGCTGYIPIQNGQTLYGYGLSFNGGTSDDNRIVMYDSSFTKISHVNRGLLVGGTSGQAVYTELENGFSIRIKNLPNTAYIRICLEKAGFGDFPAMAIDEEIAYTEAGFLVDDVKVKAENIVGKLGDNSQSDWFAAESEAGHVLNRTHYEETILPETTLSIDPEEGVGFIPQDLALNVGDKPTIIYNGTECVCTVLDMGDGQKYIGNMGAAEESFPNTGEPFLILYTFVDDANMGWGIVPLDGSSSVTLSIKKYVPIPQQYLANAFPYYIEVSGSGTSNDPYTCKETYDEIVSLLNSDREVKIRIRGYQGGVTISEKLYTYSFAIVSSYAFCGVTIQGYANELLWININLNEHTFEISNLSQD